MRFIKIIISSFFPNKCIACGDIIEDGEYCCDYCFEMLPNVDTAKFCTRCGSKKKDCQCNQKIFHFNGITAPFYNDGTAQKGFYKFKFSHKKENSKFFAERMALAVRNCYGDILFDSVAFVPLSIKRRFKRGFNQSEVLARQLSEILNLPLYENLLYCKRKKSHQYKLKPDERFKNVSGIYFCKQRVDSKNILLVDDIKTTGATLNECAKQLILNGANSVYCVTGLITERKKKNVS